MTARAAELLEAVAEMVPRFVALAKAAPGDARVPATPAWNVTDVVGHVAMEPKRYLELAAGGGDWPRDVSDLAEFDDPAPLMRFDGDQLVPADLQVGTFLGELIVHGRDIAQAVGKEWPIDPAMVPLVYLGLHQVLPGWVDPNKAGGHTATYELRLRGSTSYVYEFTNGRLAIDPGHPRRIDAHISAEPVTALLNSYGRTGQFRPAVTGKVLVWGRRPWLALSLRDRFMSA
jgi:hypothetical protein